ncbi:hypothetical protein ABZ691_10190 [Streptomyces sp. NPDC006854]|uniref:hypothetical protein n=1 Tax=Streptomyces sp. NPDC006854 TaxID=3155115 RepID=UPI00340E1812
MTTSHAQTEDGAAPLPPAKRHLRLAREAEVAHTEAGRFAVPLDLHEGAAKPATIPLVLTADEAVALHGRLAALFPFTEGDNR